MKKIVGAILLSGLIPLGLLAPSFGKVRAAHSVTIPDLLRSHGVTQDHVVGTTYAAEALRVTPYDGSPDGKKHNFFFWRVSVCVQDGIFRYDNTDLNGPDSESYLFDGTTYHHVAGERVLVSSAKGIGDSMSQFAEGRVRTFGLLPFLLQLADPRTEAVYIERTASGEDKLKVRSESGSWTLFSDESGLIRKIEVGGGAFVFSDYRSIKGLLLPFNERVFVNDRPFYELGFTRIDLRPEFGKDFFNPPDPSKQVAH